MKRSNTARIFGIAAVAMLALGLAPLANAQTCTNATLRGAFVRTDNGWVIGQNGVAMPLTGISVMTFDGNGRWTSAGFGKLNGTASESTLSGTYTVNPDC